MIKKLNYGQIPQGRQVTIISQSHGNVSQIKMDVSLSKTFGDIVSYMYVNNLIASPLVFVKPASSYNQLIGYSHKLCQWTHKTIYSFSKHIPQNHPILTQTYNKFTGPLEVYVQQCDFDSNILIYIQQIYLLKYHNSINQQLQLIYQLNHYIKKYFQQFYQIYTLVMHSNHHSQPANNFVFLGKLGEGSFGSVYKAKRISDGQLYAIKKVKVIGMKQRDKNNALKEVNILASIDTPNIINYKEAYFNQSSGELCTVMQLAQNGDLAKKIKDRKKMGQNFYEFEIWNIGKDILQGISALHERNILHRDIKPANIFFDGKGVAKIGDLNVSVCLQNKLAYTQTGTPYYASPEVWSNEPYSYECDIWSFGILLYELCTLSQPFKGKDMDEIYLKIRKCQYEQIPGRYSENLKYVIKKCLCLKRERIKMQSLKELFARNTAPKSSSILNQNNGQIQRASLTKISKFPTKYSDISKCLPEPKYNNPENDTSESFEFMEQVTQNQEMKEPTSFLTKYLTKNSKVCSQKKIDISVGGLQIKKNNQNCRPLNRSESEKQIQGLNKNSLQYCVSPKRAPASFNQAIGYVHGQNGKLKKYDKYALERLNLRKRKINLNY